MESWHSEQNDALGASCDLRCPTITHVYTNHSPSRATYHYHPSLPYDMIVQYHAPHIVCPGLSDSMHCCIVPYSDSPRLLCNYKRLTASTCHQIFLSSQINFYSRKMPCILIIPLKKYLRHVPHYSCCALPLETCSCWRQL